MNEEISKRLQEINSDLGNDKVLVAYSKFHALTLALHAKIEDPTTEGRAQVCALLNNLNNDRTYLSLVEDAQDTLQLLRDCEQQGLWNLVHQKDNIKTWYRHEIGTPVHSIKIEGVINAPLFNVCSVINECDLYTTWVPRVVESRTLYSPSRFRKFTYSRLSVPWPVASRDMCLYGLGVDMLEESNCVVVLARSCRPTTDPEHNHLPSPHGVVRVNTKRAGFLLKPLSATSTAIQVISNTDPQMSYIPYWLLNLVTKNLAHLSFTTLQSQCMQCALPNSPYQERISTNPIYSELQRILAKYQNNNNNTNNNNNNNNNNGSNNS